MELPPFTGAASYNYGDPAQAFYGYPGTSPAYAYGGFHLAPPPYGAPPGYAHPHAAAQGIVPGSLHNAYAVPVQGHPFTGPHQSAYSAASGQGHLFTGPHQSTYTAAPEQGHQFTDPRLNPNAAAPDQAYGAPGYMSLAYDAPGHFAPDPQKVGGHRNFFPSQAGALLCCANASTHPEQDRLMRETVVRKIWRNNCGQAFTEIRTLIANTSIICIAVDMEFLAPANTNDSVRTLSPDTWYHNLQEFVNNGEVLQIGLAFVFSDASGGPLLNVQTYEVNLIVDVDSAHYSQGSVDFLKEHRHDLLKHKNLGILPESISAGLLRYLPFCDANIVWVAYHGDKDIAFLLRLIQSGTRGAQIPTNLTAFNCYFNKTFPLYYDVRVLGQLIQERFKGKLTDLAGVGLLGLKKEGVAEHHAGSDSLIALRCFMEILRRSNNDNRAVLARKGLLSGAEEYTMSFQCARCISSPNISVVDVYQHNFNSEILHFSQAVQSNFNIVAFQVVLPLNSCAEESNYVTMKSMAEEIQSFEVLMGFINAEGKLAFGRVWKFFLQLQSYGDETRVVALEFAAVLASSGLTHADTTTWVTYRGGFGICCLISSFVAPGKLPSTRIEYISSCSAYFPSLYDIQMMAGRCPGLEMTRNAASLSEFAECLKVPAHPCGIITICRCFNALRDMVS